MLRMFLINIKNSRTVLEQKMTEIFCIFWCQKNWSGIDIWTFWVWLPGDAPSLLQHQLCRRWGQEMVNDWICILHWWSSSQLEQQATTYSGNIIWYWIHGSQLWSTWSHVVKAVGNWIWISPSLDHSLMWYSACHCCIKESWTPQGWSTLM